MFDTEIWKEKSIMSIAEKSVKNKTCSEETEIWHYSSVTQTSIAQKV